MVIFSFGLAEVLHTAQLTRPLPPRSCALYSCREFFSFSPTHHFVFIALGSVLFLNGLGSLNFAVVVDTLEMLLVSFSLSEPPTTTATMS